MIANATLPFTLSDAIGFFFCGAITILLFIVSFVYLKARESIYLYYALFLLFILLYAIPHLQELTGHNNGFLDHMRGNRRYIEPVSILSFSCYIFFTIPLMDITAQHRTLSKNLRIYGRICIIYSLTYLLTFSYISTHHVTVFVIARSFIFPICAYFLWMIFRYIQSPVKLFFLIGSTCYFIGSLLASIRHSNIAADFDSFQTITASAYFQLGLLLQVLFFALAMGGRVVFLHQIQDSAQRTLIDQLALQERGVKEVNKKLEEEIQARVREIVFIKENLQEQERKRIEAEYERNLIRLEMQLKQAQINPHFIFNSLNAIKFLILSKENEKATKYLVTFSRFVRMVLDKLEEDTITMDLELVTIRDYLELEKKRFNEDFSFNIITHTDQNLHQYQIPPLLLQPFVENAIWHGLLPSPNVEKIINIYIQQATSGIKIIIEDNGVGRKQAHAKASTLKHGGMGIKLTERRIELFNLQHNRRITLNIVDLHTETNKPSGTRVELILTMAPVAINKQIGMQKNSI